MSFIDFTRFCPRVYSGDGTMEGDTHDNIERMTMYVVHTDLDSKIDAQTDNDKADFTEIIITLHDITTSYRLSAVTLVEGCHTSGPDNFANHLPVLLYPELFGNDNLSKFY